MEKLDEAVKVVKCEPIRTDWFGRRFTFTKDPDRQPIELIGRKPDIGAAKYNTEDEWVQEYKEQFSTELSFM